MAESIANFPDLVLDIDRIQDEVTRIALEEISAYLRDFLLSLSRSMEDYDTVVKAWGNFSVSGGVATLDKGFNLSSTIIDSGIGDFQLTYLTAFTDADYVAIVQAINSATTSGDSKIHSQSATAVRVLIRTADAPADVGFSLIVVGRR